MTADRPEHPALLRQRRHPVFGRRCAVAASHPAITFEGARVLADGGNAVDATLAMAAVAWMVLPGQSGIGGDAFAIVREPDGVVWCVSGSGYGPDGGTPEFYREAGHQAIPMSGALSVAVPGAAAAVHTLAKHATRPLTDLWRTGITLARDGFVCTAKNRADIAERLTPILADPGMRAVFAPHGRVPQVGELLVQRDLADLLDSLAGDPLGFYTGPFAEAALAHLRAGGAPFDGAEWAAGAHAPEEQPISIGYAGGTLYQTPPPSPGWMMLHQAAMLDGLLRGGDLLDASALDAFAVAARIAFDHRYTACAADNDAWRQVLTPEAIRRDRDRLLRGGWARTPAPPGLRVEGDTTATVCIDAEGRAVSFIHSLAFTFGARTTVPGTGVVLNNRLSRGSYLVPGHPNEVRPRRKPLHTLNAWVFDDPHDGLLHAGACPGGDGQVQWNTQVLSHLVDHGLDPQQAVSVPRLAIFPGSDADVVGQPHEVRVEPGLGPTAVAGLRARGHVVVEVPEQVGGPGGSAMVISREPHSGVLSAGADPRMEGIAIAY